MRKLIGLTGPSSFSGECMEMIEDFFDANFVQLYHGRDHNIDYWLKNIDGVILAGGVDIHPTIYGESLWSACNLSKFDIKRDCRELGIVDHCLKNKLPLLGICRGHQLIGVKLGLDLIMDITPSNIVHSPSKQNINLHIKEPAHSVRIRDNHAEAFYGDDYQMPSEVPERKFIRVALKENTKQKIWVNSFHHQGLAFEATKATQLEKEGNKIIGTAKINFKNCKEIIELMEGENWISSQWHPEFDWKENTPSRVILNRFKAMLK